MSVLTIYTSYKIKIRNYNAIFRDTLAIYRRAVDYLIPIILDHWAELGTLQPLKQVNAVEHLIHRTKNNEPQYDFDSRFYKFPSYLRRGAISAAIGKVSSYVSNLQNYEKHHSGKGTSVPKAGRVFPAMYRDNMYVRKDSYTAEIKVWIRNTWDWLTVQLRKSDVDYIRHHCSVRKECVPTLATKGNEWFLSFAFEEKSTLRNTPIDKQKILAVDLGINSACACSVMNSEGTIFARKFLGLANETDSLNHALNRIKKAQQHGNYRTPRLWAAAKGVNNRIAVLTAQYIIDQAQLYDADVIVFEHLDLKGKKHGRKKQRLHMWKAQYVQEIVTTKAHRMGIHISRVSAWGTSRLAFDGSGYVRRDIDGNHSICQFTTGKIYNCDLSASYNIGARYFIREILKSLPETVRLGIEAEVPQCTKRSTCTWSSLINLNAVLTA